MTIRTARLFLGILIVPISALLLSGCATPYEKKWNEVYVTKDQSTVSACKYVDVVYSWPPYFFPNDDIRNITRRAAEVSADTILVTSARVDSTAGRAYKCH